MNWNEEPEMNRYGSPMFTAMKQLILFIAGWIGFRVFAYVVQILILLIANGRGLDGNAVLGQSNVSIILNSTLYVSLLAALLVISNKDVFKLLKSFKQWQSYVAGVVCLLAIFAFNFAYNMLIEFLKEVQIIKIPTGNNANQAAIDSLESLYPFTCVIVFGLIGPVCEEFTYRVGLFSLLKRKNKILAYVASCVIFAFIHFNLSFNTATLINELINIPLYMFAGFAFAYTYDHYGFAGSVTAHALNNLIGRIPAIFR